MHHWSTVPYGQESGTVNSMPRHDSTRHPAGGDGSAAVLEPPEGAGLPCGVHHQRRAHGYRGRDRNEADSRGPPAP
ncbi:hypothetical protein [Alloactinosynnema sp. L-07]|uniref:hypothetical protein n=1 Tax=Alloactinosynnema sp. L-07 TaxID=1653480 RepID=UPI0012F94CAF|nr:hypothetical protein [Alloactinosynnema sp. L-07]